KGLYVIRDFAPGPPKHGYVVAQGSSSTFNLVSVLPRLEQAAINVKVIAAISEELFDRQPEAYRNAVLPPEAREDLMFVMSGTRRMWPLRNVGSLTDAYSLTADQDNVWLTGGLEADVIAEAHLDAASILAAVQRSPHARQKRRAQRRALLDALRWGQGMARTPLAAREQIADTEQPAYDAFMASRANRPAVGPYTLLLHMPEMAQRLEAL